MEDIVEEKKQMEITFEVIDKKTGITIFENSWSGIELDFSISVSHNTRLKKETMNVEETTKHKRKLHNLIRKNERWIAYLLTFLIVCFVLGSLYYTLATLLDKHSSDFDQIAKWTFFTLTLITVVLKLMSYHDVEESERK